MSELTAEQRAALAAQLRRAQDLGFLGPGPVEPHLDHALVFVAALHGLVGTVVDLGSGGGLPGLVVAMARPDLTLVLVDSRAVRCRFLEAAVAELSLDATVVEARAEVVGRGPLRGAARAVVARSFGAPAATAECAAPLLEVGGRLVVSEPPEPDDRRWPAAGLAPLGLVDDGLVQQAAARARVLRQASPCPDRFPRREGLPAKRPLF